MLYKSDVLIDLPIKYSVYRDSGGSENFLKTRLHQLLGSQDYRFPIYLGFDNLKREPKGYLDEGMLNMVHVRVTCRVYYYRPQPAETVLIRVADIDERGHILGTFFNLKVFIHKSNFAQDARLRLVNNVKMLNSGSRAVRVSDILKMRVIDIVKDRYWGQKINGSIRGLTYGKLAWFK